MLTENAKKRNHPPASSAGDKTYACSMSTNWRGKTNLAADRLGAAAHAQEFYSKSLTLKQITDAVLVGYRVAPGTFENNHRNADNLTGGLQIAGFDFDHNSVADLQADDLFGPYSFLTHSTTSSEIVTDNNPDGDLRARAWVALLEPLEPELFELFMAGMYRLSDLEGDEGTASATIGFFGSINRAEQPVINLEAVLPPEIVNRAIAAQRRHLEAQQPVYAPYEGDDTELVSAIVSAAKARGYKGRGKFINGRCLFHDDKEPSAGISIETGVLKCFACGNHSPRDVADQLGIDWQRFEKPFTSKRNPMTAAQPHEGIAAGVPDSIRTALLKYCEPSTAPVVELIDTCAEMGLIDPTRFDVPALIDAKSQLPAFSSMSESTLRRGVKFLVGLFLSELETVFNGLGSNSGRNAKQYGVLPGSEFRQNIEHQAAKRIYEKHHPVDETDSLSPILTEITPGMVRDSGITEKPREIAHAANDRLSFTQWQGEPTKHAKKAAQRELARLKNSLHAATSTPLPDGWSLGTAKDFRAAYRRALNDARPGETMSRREQMDTFGIKNGSIKTLTTNAGLEPKLHFERLPVVDVMNLEAKITQYGREIRGYPKRIVAETTTGEEIPVYYDPKDTTYVHETIERHLAQGHQVSVEYQTANSFEATTEGQPQREETERKPTVKRAVKTEEKHYGPTYDPRWLAGQYLLGLEALGWKRMDNMLIDPDSGEIVDRDTSPKHLLQLILNIPPPPDPLLDFAVQHLGASITPYDRQEAIS